MARTSRQKSGTGVYHIMMRGINHQNIFRDDADKDKFLDLLLGSVTYRTNLSGEDACRSSIYAYALMGNHFHLLVRVESGEPGELIKKIAAGYVRYFNNRHKCDGHLFKERFRSEPCENFNYFCVLMGYIHQNPIKHGFATSLQDYKYTSWGEYFEPENTRMKICNVGAVLARMSLEDIRRWIVEMLPENLKCVDIDRRSGEISDESIVNHLRERYGIVQPSSVRDMKPLHRKALIADLLDFGGTVRQISRVTGVSAMAVSRVNAKLGADPDQKPI